MSNQDPNAALNAAQQRHAEELASMFKSFDKKGKADRAASLDVIVSETSALIPAGPDATPNTPTFDASAFKGESEENVPTEQTQKAPAQRVPIPAPTPAAWREVIDDNPLDVPIDLLDRLMEAASLVPETPVAPRPPAAPERIETVVPAVAAVPAPVLPSPEPEPVMPPMSASAVPTSVIPVPEPEPVMRPSAALQAEPTHTDELPRVELQWDDPSPASSTAAEKGTMPQIMLPERPKSEVAASLPATLAAPEPEPRPVPSASKSTPAPLRPAQENAMSDALPNLLPNTPDLSQPEATSGPSSLDMPDGPSFILPMYPSAMPFLGRFLPQSNPTHMGLNQAHTELHKFLQHLQQIGWNGYLHVALGDQSAYALLFEGRIVGAAVAHAVNEEALGELMNLYDQGANLSAHPLSASYAHILSGVGSRAWKLAPTEEFTGVYAKPVGSAFYLDGQVIAVSSVSLPYEGSFPAALRPKTISLPRSHARWAHIQYVLTLKGKDALNPITDTNMDFRARYGDKGIRFLRSVAQGVMPVDYASRSDLILHELEPMVHAWVQGGYMRDRDEV